MKHQTTADDGRVQAEAAKSAPGQKELQRRRMIALTLFVFAAMAALSYRLYVIQIQRGEEYAAMAWSQQRIPISGADGRAAICDRRGVAFTGESEEYLYILRRERLDDSAQRYIAALKGRERKTSNEKYRIIAADAWHPEASAALKEEYGAYILKLPQRYQENQAAIYLLGYIRSADGRGMAGLEKAFDEWLSLGQRQLYAVGDAKNSILTGYSLKSAAGQGRRLITTLDKRLQMQIEDIVNRVTAGRCCAVVTEAATGDILACASAPGFDPARVEELLDSPGQELVNIAMQGQYPPGSVFKIAVAAAALESGACTEESRFFCTGSQTINGVTIGCSAKEGHGMLTMEQAFAKSCNCAFIQMGQEAGAQAVLDMAERLGFGSNVLSGLSMDKEGNLTVAAEAVGAGIGNLSIGQGTLLATPLQVAQMTQIVANDGMATGLYLVSEKEEGAATEVLPRQVPRRVMSFHTAQALRSMMRATVMQGTARSLAQLDCGGKTGSAEAVADGKETVHAWFTGVVPADMPRYTITVFVENGGSGGAAAVPVFGDIVQCLTAWQEEGE